MAWKALCHMCEVFFWNCLIFHLVLSFFIQNLTLGDDEYDDFGNPQEAAGYMRREFSILKPLSGGSILQHWELSGASILTDKHLRLTPDEQSKSGAVWSILPCHVRDWEIHIQFKVHGHNYKFFGDGFSFWYTKVRNQLGPVFGSIDYFSGLAMFFDTYANQNGEHAHEHPYISAQVNNGSIHYDHDRDGTHSELAGCTSHFRGSNHDSLVAIRYLGTKKRLTVQYDVEEEGKWTECFDRFNVELPTGYFLGLSAKTGDLSDVHDILSVKFFELESGDNDDKEDYSNIIPNAADSEADRPHSDDPEVVTRGQRILSWFTIIAIVALISGLAGFYYYQNYQRNQLKRFY